MRQFARFIGVGGFATLTHFLIAVAAVRLFGVGPLLANLLGYLTAFAVSFLGHWKWTFREAKTPLARALPFFLAISLAMFAANHLLFYALTVRLGVPLEPSLILAQGAVVILTFLLNHHIVFNQRLRS